MINTIKHLAYSVRSSEEELSAMMMDADKYYLEWSQPKMKYGEPQKEKGSTKMRELCASTRRLKIIQGKINSLLRQIPSAEFAYGGVIGKNNILNALQHVNGKFFLSVDLKNYFSNITHHQVFEMFREQGFSPNVSRILTRLTTYKGKLPQGARTSPLVANLVFLKTGHLLSEFCTRHDITFTALFDDLTFSACYNFKHLVPTLLEIVKSGGFFLHHKKISFTTDSGEVTGLIVKQRRIYVKQSMLKRKHGNPHLANYIHQIENLAVNKRM